MDNWIYTKDRLPESENRYLVVRSFMSHYRISICWFATNLEDVDEYEFSGRRYGGFYDYDDEWGHCELTDVVCWAPLPELPLTLGGKQ